MFRTIPVLTVWAAFTIATIPSHAQTRREATIEVGAKTQLVLQSRLSSKLNEVGDPVIATLAEAITVNGLLVMPRDAEFHGRVTSVKPAGRAHKSAKMSIIFEKVLTPWGEERVSVVITAIDDWDNDKKLKPDSEGKVNGGRQGEKGGEKRAHLCLRRRVASASLRGGLRRLPRRVRPIKGRFGAGGGPLDGQASAAHLGFAYA